ncbi:DUF5977 domain-containing protein [Sphingobacterium thalpophilum]|uniref:DUF5977 domain-containing protein n=1 Tax=Sphingobacterium thalpophilum TaxID=259 RepID=UPI0031D20D5C
MKKKILQALQWVILVLATNFVFGQEGLEIGKVTISSPTAASLGKYVDIPVNKNTGIPEISIPIYTVSSGSLKLPVSLGYHAGGLKVQEISSWVGTGFAVQAGGAITRTVRGLPDDRSGLVTQTKAHYRDYGYSSYFYRTGTQMADLDFATGKLDGEPDLFFFNFNGYSGKFYFNDDRTPMLVPEQDLKIEVGMTESVGTIEGFTVTTPDGTKYYFGKNGSPGTVVPIEKTSVYSSKYGKTSGTPVSSWFLNKIQSADGLSSITLTYQPEKYSYYTMSPQEIDGQYKDSYPSGQRDAYLVKNSVEGVRLSQISWPTGTVDFIVSDVAREDLARYDINTIVEYANTESKALKEIRISSATNSFCKKYIFDHGYFSSYNYELPVVVGTGVVPQSDKKRLKLLSLQEISCDGIEKGGLTQFSYFNETVPSTLSFAQDYWGFYNGMDNNKTIIPTIRENGNPVSGGDRNPYWPSMRAGTLESITYPTGGSTTFEFEPHDTYVNYIDYQTSWQHISLGGDGNIFRTIPDSLVIVSDGSGMLVEVTNQSTVNDGNVWLYNPKGTGSTFSISCPKGQTKRQYASLPAGKYYVRMEFVSAGGNPAGQPLVASIGKNIQVGVNANARVGGLRIKTVTEKTSEKDIATVTSYSYLEDASKSSGELYHRPTFAMVKRNDLQKLVKDDTPNQANYSPPYCNVNGCENCEFLSGTMGYVKSGGDLRPMASIQGQHMGYRRVKVSKTGNGYSLYNYYWSKFLQYPYLEGPPGAVANLLVNTLACDPKSPNYPTAPLPFEYQKGMPQSETHYDNAGKIIKDIQFNYVFKDSKMFTPAYIVVNEAKLWGTFYNLNTGRKIEEETIETTYSTNGSSIVHKKNIYGSPYHNQITKTIVWKSDGDTISTNKQYAFEYRPATVNAINDGLTSYLAKDSTAKAVLDKAIYNAEFNHQGNRWVALQDYKHAKIAARVEFINYRKENFTNTTNAYKTAHDAAKAAAGALLKPILQLQDNFQNPAIEVTDRQNSKVVGTIYSSYAIDGATTRTYPTSSEVIDISNTSPSFVVSKVSGNNIVKDSRYRNEISVKYIGGNLVESKSKRDMPNAYLWGYGGQFPIAHIKNATYAEVVAALGQTTINSLNAVTVSDALLKSSMTTLRSALPKAMVESYIYKPLIGMTRKTDARDIFEAYSYDALGRLSAILDHKDNVIKAFHYNYAKPPVTYKNDRMIGYFVKSDCGSGYEGERVAYVVDEGKYTSVISKDDANNLAQKDINENGQTYANTNGTCKGLGTFIFAVEQRLWQNSVSGSYSISIDGQDKTGFRGIPLYGTRSTVECGNVPFNTNATIKITFWSVSPGSVKIAGFWGNKTAVVVGNVATFTGFDLSTSQGMDMIFY